MKKACALYLGLAIHFSSFAYSFETWAKNHYFFLRFSFHRHIIVTRMQRDEPGRGLVPIRAQQMCGSFTPVCAFLIFSIDFVGAAFMGSDLHPHWGVLRAAAVFPPAALEAPSLKLRVLAGPRCLAGVSSSRPKYGYEGNPM